ncbi:hypothetical protein [Neomesorhizobium albiziae]|uniref:hypothetical protein n=1 Tax=Neomesorhizobium albiziae TaxID=335020 RepID=UPI00122C317A|nr:hypothetical protein [Mesorhizobium albiziae]
MPSQKVKLIRISFTIHHEEYFKVFRGREQNEAYKKGFIMVKANEKIAKRIAHNQAFDGYAAWRMLKDINSEIFSLERNKSAVPFELVRLRWLIVRARELRKASEDNKRARPSLVPRLPIEPQAADEFDAFEFVDRYRALGGRRIAWVMGERITLGPTDSDTPEARELWLRIWSPSAPTVRNAISEALLVRGRF